MLLKNVIYKLQILHNKVSWTTCLCLNKHSPFWRFNIWWSQYSPFHIFDMRPLDEDDLRNIRELIEKYGND